MLRIHTQFVMAKVSDDLPFRDVFMKEHICDSVGFPRGAAKAKLAVATIWAYIG